ncbi:MAG: bifunctional UDP-sugar hydrolase/5'-nucleotidase [Planctomycetota bacterium]|nr:bifunctional UDP-sugar hydrolase/5'-nucleotidase [Planctomycetota bacterium]
MLRLSGLLLAALCVGLHPASRIEESHLVILHTNDVHGQAKPRPATWLKGDPPPEVGGLPRLAAMVKAVHEEVGEQNVLLLDGGDWTQGTPEGLMNEGASFVEAMVAVGYDAMCVGNHELDHGLASLEAMIQATGAPAVLANVRAEDGERVSLAPSHRIFDRAGLKVAVVGLLTPVTPSITHSDAKALSFADPVVELTRVRAELGEAVDLVIPATHLGVDTDRLIAQAHPDLPFIVGGHSHTYLREGVIEGEVLIGQVGSKASNLGRLDLWLDSETHEVLRSEYKVVSLLDEPAGEARSEVVDALCAALVAKSEAKMKEVVGELTAPLTRAKSSLESSPAGNLIADTFRAHFDAECAFQNRGGIRCDLPKGAVTRRDLFEILPFGNHPVLLELKGEHLEGTLRQAVEGTSHSGLEVSGLTLEVTGGDQPKLVGVLVNGEALDPKRTYRVATNNFLAEGGDNFLLLAEAESVTHDQIYLRTLLEQRFKGGSLTPPIDNRYRVR